MNKAWILPILILLICIYVDQTYAQMRGSSYIIDTESTTPQKKTQKVEKTTNSHKSNTIQGIGFTALLSDSRDLLNKPFIFSISDSFISFGNIKPGEPVVRNQAITLTPGSAHGYQVLASEVHPLRSEDKNEIPNTSCDNGNCTNMLSDYWQLPLTYGFGYRCENIISQPCLAGINEATYKRFSNTEVDEAPSLILYSGTSENSKALIEYKINIPGNQPDTSYTTTITLFAFPNL